MRFVDQKNKYEYSSFGKASARTKKISVFRVVDNDLKPTGNIVAEQKVIKEFIVTNCLYKTSYTFLILYNIQGRLHLR